MSGELSGGSFCSDAVKVSVVPGGSPCNPDWADPPAVWIGEPGGVGPFPSEPWSSAVISPGVVGRSNPVGRSSHPPSSAGRLSPGSGSPFRVPQPIENRAIPPDQEWYR